MRMTPRLQKLSLFAHVTFSVGWLGAIVPYVALAIAVLTAHDSQTLQAAYLGMKFIGWFVIVPLSLLALLSGVIQSLGTRWGLLRYWWIVAKLALTVFATFVLVRHMQDVTRLSLTFRAGGLSDASFRPELIHSVGGLLVLLTIVAVSIFKPWGITPYGQRQRSRDFGFSIKQPAYFRAPVRLHGQPVNWTRIVGYHALVLAVLLVILHAAGFQGPHHH